MMTVLDKNEMNQRSSTYCTYKAVAWTSGWVEASDVGVACQADADDLVGC